MPSAACMVATISAANSRERGVEDGDFRAFFAEDGIVVVNNSQRHRSVGTQSVSLPFRLRQLNTVLVHERHPVPSGKPPLAAFAWLIAGLGLLGLAWSLPVNLKSVSPALLTAAGEGTPTVGAFGRDLVDDEKLGPAALVLTAARALGDPRAPALATAIDELAAHQPELVAWGGWDPFLDPLFNLHENKGHAASTPVLTFLLPAKARTTLRAYLANSRSLGVQTMLKTADLTATGRFVPAGSPGGQPLDAVILLSALLYQGEHLSPSLQRELRGLADTALEKKSLGDLEPFYLDLLSLASGSTGCSFANCSAGRMTRAPSANTPTSRALRPSRCRSSIRRHCSPARQTGSQPI